MSSLKLSEPPKGVSFPRISHRNPRAWVASAARQADLILAFALAIAATNLVILLSSPIGLPGLSFLDHSWAFDLVVKMQQRVWAGTEVAFTYGPLFQLATSLFPNLLGGSLGTYFRGGHVLFSCAAIAFTFLTGRMLLGGHSVWKRCFFLLLLVGFWGALDMRFCFDLFALAVAIRHFDRTAQSPNLRWGEASLLAAVPIVGFLISTDTGAYAVAACAIAGTFQLLVGDRAPAVRLRIIRSAATAGVAFLLLAAILPMATGALSSVAFWTDSGSLLSNYRWSMAGSMDKAVKWRLVSAAALATLVLAFGWKWRDPLAGSLSRRPVFFPAAVAFSWLTLQSAIVRPDWGHVSIALLPTVAMAAAVLMGSENSQRWSWRGDLPLLCAFILSAIYSGPASMITPKHLLAGLRVGSIQRSETCPAGRHYIDGACVLRGDYERLHTVSQYLKSQSTPSETIGIFPYENIYAAVARRRVAGGVLQNYMVTSPRLVRRHLLGLERDRPRIAIFSADGVGTHGIDGVPNFTRSPELWFYFQRHFERQAELAPGVLALRRDDSRSSRMHLESIPISTTSQSSAPRHQRLLQLAIHDHPANTDFLKVRIKVSYPLWWKLRKPSWIRVRVGYVPQGEDVFYAVLPPNQWTDVWIYPWNDADLASYFYDEEKNWRQGRTPRRLTSLTLHSLRMDDFSVVPSEIAVESVNAVLLRLR